MSAPSRKPSDDSWVEYRRLILAELERLNECVDRLRDQHATNTSEMRQEIARTCRKVANNLNARLTDIHSDRTAIINRITALEMTDHVDSHSNKRKDRWAFWTAVITIIGTLIASIISLWLSTQQTGH